MAKLILSLDGAVIREFKLEKDITSLGRKPHNDLQIDNLAVSGEHARVCRVGASPPRQLTDRGRRCSQDRKAAGHGVTGAGDVARLV